MEKMSKPIVVGRVIRDVIYHFTANVKMTVTYHYNRKQVFNRHELFLFVVKLKLRFMEVIRDPFSPW